MTNWDTFSMFKDIVFKGKINIVILKEERKNWCSYCKPLRFGLLWYAHSNQSIKFDLK